MLIVARQYLGENASLIYPLNAEPIAKAVPSKVQSQPIAAVGAPIGRTASTIYQ